MDKDSRRRQQGKRCKDFLNNKGSFTFDGGDHDDALRATFTHLIFIQVFLLFLYHTFLPGDLMFGYKEKEAKRDCKPFDEKIGHKLSDYFFWWVYRMEWHPFNRLFEIPEPLLERIFFLCVGGYRKENKSQYSIDTKPRLSIAICFFIGTDPCNIM
jgi:hypothetical protein